MSNSTTERIISPLTGKRSIIDLTGQRFGKLVIVALDGIRVVQGSGRTYSRAYWLCQCDCGESIAIRGDGLTSSGTRSCGCIRPPARFDLAGQRFGKLVVVARGDARYNGKQGAYWKCQCDCGESSVVKGGDLRRGFTTSCGCNARGENHHGWNPDRDHLDSRLKVSNLLNNWRRDVYERDGYTCQACGDATGGNLNAHHLDSWTAFPDKRMYLDNGITLCEPCHKEFHSSLGWTHVPCTKADYIEWVNG